MYVPKLKGDYSIHNMAIAFVLWLLYIKNIIIKNLYEKSAVSTSNPTGAFLWRTLMLSTHYYRRKKKTFFF